ncbi:MAG TPA: hypothetical protein DCM64_03845 [Gammaproteobacteria bacterium]|jgi:predicted transcriptional regulator|nr:BlaI/MecI/CopY family transcriptional regulator [Gammaproteobacteria bacterium]MDP6733010.1 BlaI/MecI/CopY family transcriptional regulator [Gammaproteobacteria bacterium]HAJ75568.1 hypothetical protein [Gammaproteobacteria bacterium]|tara:strand:- start:2317 stop:2706 length:390 start_codon:yes stop_codon:yes gene_type:complete
MKETPLLTGLELELMQIIWKNEDVSVEFLRQQLADSGRPLALPSIRTMLNILKKKGFVNRRQVSRAYVYNALIKADEFQYNFIRDALNRAFSGSPTGLVTALLNRELVSKSELDQIKTMISDYERGKKK